MPSASEHSSRPRLDLRQSRDEDEARCGGGAGCPTAKGGEENVHRTLTAIASAISRGQKEPSREALGCRRGWVRENDPDPRGASPLKAGKQPQRVLSGGSSLEPSSRECEQSNRAMTKSCDGLVDLRPEDRAVRARRALSQRETASACGQQARLAPTAEELDVVPREGPGRQPMEGHDPRGELSER
jgi:hypothetical protein